MVVVVFLRFDATPTHDVRETERTERRAGGRMCMSGRSATLYIHDAWCMMHDVQYEVR
jgi:hypothetical protein